MYRWGLGQVVEKQTPVFIILDREFEKYREGRLPVNHISFLSLNA